MNSKIKEVYIDSEKDEGAEVNGCEVKFSKTLNNGATIGTVFEKDG